MLALFSCSNRHIYISAHRSQISPPTAVEAVRDVPGVRGVGGGHPRGPPIGAEWRGRWVDYVGATGSLHRHGHHMGLLGVISTVVLMATACMPILTSAVAFSADMMMMVYYCLSKRTPLLNTHTFTPVESELNTLSVALAAPKLRLAGTDP